MIEKVLGRLLLLVHHQLHHVILIHEFLAEANSLHILKHVFGSIQSMAQLVTI